MNKPLYKNLQNIDMNKTLHFGVNITDEDKQTHCVKMSFKDIYCNWNIQTQIDSVIIIPGEWYMNNPLSKNPSEYRYE